MSPEKVAGVAALLLAVALVGGRGLALGLRRWNQFRVPFLVEAPVVGGAAIALGGLGTFAAAFALGGRLSTDPSVLSSGPWLVAGLLATSAAELLLVTAAAGLGVGPLGGLPAWRWWLGGLIAGPALLAAGAAWGLFVEWLGYRPEPQQLALALANESGWVQALVIIFVAVGAPILEELCFRGWLLPRVLGLTQRWPLGSTTALAATSASFAGMHADAVWAFPPLFLVGLACGWLRLRSRSTLPGILAHAGHNGIALTLVLGL